MVSTGEVTNQSLVGSLLGKDYRVLQQIGRGGMAVVYLVEHQKLLKKFAAKVLSAEHASNEEARARFTQEAHAASQLDHENIVTISDFGITPDDRPFYVMELLRGRTLMDRLEDGPMTLEEVVAVSVPVARALAHAHKEGVVHRDVKPENIFLVQRSQGRWSVKVLDFGIAKVTTNPSLTKMGQALGSPMFMAPEACRGDDVDARADLYSFGVVLYLMLTGKVPFMDESLLKILQMQVSNPVPPLRDSKPDISLELEAVVMRALKKKPEDRYPTMDAMLFDLQAVLPEGSDALLQLAQFGTSVHDTPFPGQSLRMLALSSQRLMVGGQDVSTQLEPATASGQFPTTTSSGRFPVAPQKRRRGLLIAIPALLAVGAAAAYVLWPRDAEKPVAGDPPPAVATPAPEPTPPPKEIVPATPRRVGPDPSVAVVEPDKTPPDPVATKAVVTPPTPAVTRPAVTTATTPPAVAKRPPEPPKIVTKVETPPPATTVPKTGSATPPTKPPTAGSAEKPAIAVTPVTPPETPVKPPPTAGSGVVPPPVKPVTPAVVADVGSLDATPSISGLDVNGPLPGSVVRRSIERALPALRACYKTAAKAKNATPAVTLSIAFEVDEHSSLTGVSVRGGQTLASLPNCARGAISRLQTQQAPDVGTANVVVTITFKPT